MKRVFSQFFRGRCAVVCIVAILAAGLVDAFAATPDPVRSGAPQRDPIAGFVTEAAQLFSLPERWIWSVMRAESAFDPTATSRAGEMGLMQVMPATYAELRARYRLGPDPYAPRDNILAGTAYLRELYDRFGGPGFLAAYNAGPGRYAKHLKTGRPLPLETRLYVARIAPQLGQDGALPASVQKGAMVVQPAPLDPFAAPIFARAGSVPTGQVSPGSADPASLFPARTGREMTP